MRRTLPIVFLLAACGASSAPSWSPVALPQARHGHRVEAIGGGLLAFGGFVPGEDGAGRQTLWLGPGAAAWQPRAAMQRGRSFFASAVIDGEVYAIGEGVERHDAAADRWTVVCAAGALPRSHLAAAAVGREIFVLGGYPREQSGFWIVDVDDGAVRAAPPPPGFEPGDHFHFMACLDGELHVVGGLDAEAFAPQMAHHVREGDGWRALPPPPPGLWSKFGDGVVHRGEWFVFGEFGGHRFRSGRGWRTCRGWEGMVAMPALVAIGDGICSLGGLAVEGPRRPLLRTYAFETDRWRERE